MSCRKLFPVVVFAALALGAPLSGATAQTSPDDPSITSPTGVGVLQPTSGTALPRPSPFVYASAFGFETFGAQWLSRWVSGRNRMLDVSASRRWVPR